jgi:hypothetical protein
MSSRRNGGAFVYDGHAFEYSLVATKSYRWGIVALNAAGGFATTPRALWFAKQSEATTYAGIARKDLYNFGYALAKAEV